MIKINDLGKAKENIDKLFQLRDELISASPYLNDMKSNLSWYEKVCAKVPDGSEEILSSIEVPVQGTLSLSPTNLDYNSVTGTTGSYFAVSAGTREIIKSYGSQYYHLIIEYDEINKTEIFIDRIGDVLKTFRPDLQPKIQDLLFEAKDAYSKWKAGSINNSDLAKDIRSFQDFFYGLLHRARIHTYDPIPKKFPESSWPKMAETLGKSSEGCQKMLRSLQGAEEKFHSLFTEILKKTKEMPNSEFERYFKDYIEHVYSILNLINQDLLK